MIWKLIIFWSLVIWAAVLFMAIFGVPGFLFSGAVLVVIAMAFSRYRQTRRDAFVQLLALAAERQMPFAPLAGAFAKESHSSRFAWLAARLEAGEPLTRALYQTGAIDSPALAVAAISGETTGALAPALRDAVRARKSQLSLWNVAGEQLLYLCMLILFSLAMIGFQTWKIMPAMQRIFDDFNTELPALTQVVMRATEFTFQSGLAVLLAIAAMGAMLLFLGYYIGWVRFRVPILGRLTDRLDSAGILRAFALAVQQQQTVEAVRGALAPQHPNGAIRKKLRRAGDDIFAGRDWVDAFLVQRLIRPSEAAVLRAAQKVGNLPWALRETADSIERRLAYRLHALAGVIFPLAIVLIGLVVMIFVVGYFLPLVKLITSMT